MIQKTVGLRPSKLFQEVLSTAISNAAYAGKKTITAKDVRNIATYRLKYNKGLDPNTVAELRRMATLRGVINSSGDVFMRNGKLNSVAKFTISDKISALAKLKSKVNPYISKVKDGTLLNNIMFKTARKCPDFFPRSVFVPKDVAHKPMLSITDRDLAKCCSDIIWPGRDTVNLSSKCKDKSALKKVLEKLGLGEDATFLDVLKKKRKSSFESGRMTLAKSAVSRIGGGVEEGYTVCIKG